MRLVPCLAALALCLAVAATAQAQQVYQWKDKNGVTHYSDSPPPNQTVQNRRINQYGAPAAETTFSSIMIEPISSAPKRSATWPSFMPCVSHDA